MAYQSCFHSINGCQLSLGSMQITTANMRRIKP